jgi:hypothetical protein
MFEARATAYMKPAIEQPTEITALSRQWVMTIASSEEGYINALEKMWNSLSVDTMFPRIKGSSMLLQVFKLC